MKKIEVHAASSQQAVLDHQCDEVRECDTIKEAKEHAKYCLTPRFAKANECQPMRYAQVVVDGECAYDYFAKEVA